jgi:hypothetical protein
MRLALLTALLFVAIAAPAQAISRDQCVRMAMGATSSAWAPDDDVMAQWRYYESRGYNIVSATPTEHAWYNSYTIDVGWAFGRKNGSYFYHTIRCHDYGNNVRADWWIY